MSTFTEAPRTDVELQAIASALLATRGAAPAWLRSELGAPVTLPPIKADPDAYRWHMKAALSVGCLLAAFVCGVDNIAEVKATSHIVARPIFVVDADALDAIAIAQESSLAGDELPILQRLGGIVRHPDGRKAWSAEKTGPDTYLVIYREPAGVPAYAFEVDLESEFVAPTPEAVDALALMRVRDADAQLHLVARAD